MPLPAGARLGPYEIVGTLGAGGMGEVYKARDTRLDRIVAVKVLSEQLAADPHFRARFDLEARAISQLAHPNICILHDVGEDHGVSFLVMEYLEGETLAERIAQGPLPLAEALPIALQMGAALERAHHAGIVHRDLKPGNVFLTKVGAKLLDFGLAKSAPAVAAGALSVVPTTPPAPMTSQGTILGTFQYMAPEQLDGSPADARTDIFAFGAVLYEMVTGRRAFGGRSQATIIGSIMASQPPPLSSIVPETPQLLDHLVRMCLAKDPSDRYQSAHDVVLLLQSVGELTRVSAAAAERERSRRWGPVSMAVGAATLAAVAAALVTSSAVRREPAMPMRFTMATAAGEPFTAGPTGHNVAISPDGHHIVYHVRSGSAIVLFLRTIDQLNARPLTAPDVATNPFFSPDSQWVGFYDSRSRTVKKVSTDGGSSTNVAAVTAMGGASWGDDGMIVFAEGGTGLARVPVAGGELERLLALETDKGETDQRMPFVLPGSRAVLFTSFRGADIRQAEVAVLDLRTRERKTLVKGGFAARYLSTGHIVFAQANSLLAVSFDPDRLEIRGTPRPVQEGVGTKSGGAANYDVSNTGTLIYGPGGAAAAAKGRVLWIGRDGRDLGPAVAAELEAPAFPRLSPDGRRLALNVAGDMWVYDLDNRPPIKVTVTGRSYTPLWSTDGQRLFYEDAEGKLAWVPTDGRTTTPEPASPDGHFHPSGWLSSGEIAVVQLGLTTGNDIVSFAPGVKADLKPIVNTEASEGGGGLTVSPDGKWLAYVSDITGRGEVYVRAASEAAAPRRVSVNGGLEPQWSRNGRELYFIEDRETMMMAAVNTDAGLTVTPPVVLFKAPFLQAGQPPSYDVAPDGRFLFARATAGQAEPSLVVAVNWFEELKNRVPIQ
jgi:serine/threonine-protein kinase